MFKPQRKEPPRRISNMTNCKNKVRNTDYTESDEEIMYPSAQMLNRFGIWDGHEMSKKRRMSDFI